MTDTLVVVETRRGELREVSLELLGAALELKDESGGRLLVAVLDHEPERFAQAVSADGVDELLLVPTPSEHFEAHVSQRVLEELIEAERPGLVLLGHTIDSLGFGPAVAARRGLGFASDVISVTWDDGPVAGRGAYGDKLLAELEFPAKDCTLLMLRPGTFIPAAVGAQAASARTVELALDGVAETEHVGFEEAQDADVDITKAPFLVSIGRGVEDKDEIPRFEALAERLGATLSVSRGLDAKRPAGGPVGQDGQAARVPGAGNLRRRSAPGGDAHGGDDHRRQHRPGGADLRRCSLRRCGRPV